jgi:hypothetical protein
MNDEDDYREPDVQPSSLVDLRTLMIRAFEALDALQEGEVTQIPSGLEALDRLTGGLVLDSLVLLHGRPRVGKTALALQVALAVGADKPVLFCSPATSMVQLCSRLLSLESGVESQALRGKRDLTGEDYGRLVAGAAHLEKRTIWFDDTMHLTAEHLGDIGRALTVRHHLGLIVVDDAELLVPREGPEPSIVRTSMLLSELSGAFLCPVLATMDLESPGAMAAGGEKRLAEWLVGRADASLQLECASPRPTPAAKRKLTVLRGGVEAGSIGLLFDRRRLAFREVPAEKPQRSRGQYGEEVAPGARRGRRRGSPEQQSLDEQLGDPSGSED